MLVTNGRKFAMETSGIKTENTAKRLLYPDLIKFFAIGLVLLMHEIIQQPLGAIPLGSKSWLIMQGILTLTHTCIPLFFMVSGIFFLNTNKDLTIKTIYSKYIKRLAIGFLFWSVVYLILDTVTGKITGLTFGKAVDIVLLNYHMHLWFIFRMIALYMMCPILRKWVANATKREMQYFLLLFLLFGLLNPTFLKIGFTQKIGQFLSSFEMDYVTGFIGYFVAGFYFSKYDISPKIKKILYVIGLLSLGSVIIITRYKSIKEGNLEGIFYNYKNFFIGIVSISAFVFFKQLNSMKLHPLLGRCITWIAKMSFGIYLVHEMFNVIFNRIGFTIFTFPLAVAIPLVWLSVFVCSIITVWICSKIPILKKTL